MHKLKGEVLCLQRRPRVGPQTLQADYNSVFLKCL